MRMTTTVTYTAVNENGFDLHGTVTPGMTNAPTEPLTKALTTSRAEILPFALFCPGCGPVKAPILTSYNDYMPRWRYTKFRKQKQNQYIRMIVLTARVKFDVRIYTVKWWRCTFRKK